MQRIRTGTSLPSLPGAGPVLGPRLLASMGSQRERFGAASQLQHYTGIAPVTKRSGGSCYIHRRYLCPKFHRQSFHEYAKESILRGSRWAAAYYLGNNAPRAAPSHSGAGAGFQMATHHLALLAGSQTVLIINI